MKGRHYLVVLLAIAMVFVFASCQQEIDNGIAEVSFASGNNAGSKAVTIGDGERTAFEGLTHQIKFISNSGTGFCDLAGAKNGFVAWPTSSVKLGYGSWTVCAQSVNSAGEVVYKNDGVAFTVGNSGLYVDGVKSSNVVITESYCYSAKAKISVSENLRVLTEDGIDINSLDANSSYRTDYTVKWYTSSSADISSLGNANYVSELAGFTLWDNPTVAIEADGLTYALGVIVDNKNDPGFIYGSALVMLEGLSNGRVYTIGSKSGEYLQFGVRAVVITNDDGEGGDQGEVPDWNLVGHWEATEALPYENVELLGSGMYKYELDIFSNKTMNVTCSLTSSDKPLDHIGGLIMGTGVNFDLRIASTENPAVNYIASALNPDEGIVAKADTAEWGTLYIWLKNGNIQAFVPDLEGEVDNTTPRTFNRVSETPHVHSYQEGFGGNDYRYHSYIVSHSCGCSFADKLFIERHKLNANSVCTTCGMVLGNEDPYNQAASDFSRLFEVPFVDRSIFNSSELTYVRYDNYNALYIRGNSAYVLDESFNYFYSVFSETLDEENFITDEYENYTNYIIDPSCGGNKTIKMYHVNHSEDLAYILWHDFDYEQGHTHSLVLQPYVAPTCTTPGNNEYWECSVCGKFFSDSEGNNEIEASSIVIPELDGFHLFSNWLPNPITEEWTRVCDRCGLVESIDEINETFYISNDGCLYSRDSSKIAGTIIIPEYVNETRVISIGDLSWCNDLTSITIPDSVTGIGENAFAFCSKLSNISFEGTVSQWNSVKKEDGWNINVPAEVVLCSDGEVSINNWHYSIEEQAFAHDLYGLIGYPDTHWDRINNLSSFSINYNVDKIGAYAFLGCDNLNIIGISSSVYYLGDYVFLQCNNLTDIYYSGTIAEWNNIEKGIGWCDNTHLLEIHCSDGSTSNLVGTWEKTTRFGQLEGTTDFFWYHEGESRYSPAYSRVDRVVFSEGEYQITSDISIDDAAVVRAVIKGNPFFGLWEDIVDQMSDDELVSVLGVYYIGSPLLPVAIQDGTYFILTDSFENEEGEETYSQKWIGSDSLNIHFYPYGGGFELDIHEPLGILNVDGMYFKVSEEPQFVSRKLEEKLGYIGTWTNRSTPAGPDGEPAYSIIGNMVISESAVQFVWDIEIENVTITRAILKEIEENLKDQESSDFMDDLYNSLFSAGINNITLDELPEFADFYNSLISAGIDNMTEEELKVVLGKILLGFSSLPMASECLKYSYSYDEHLDEHPINGLLIPELPIANMSGVVSHGMWGLSLQLNDREYYWDSFKTVFYEPNLPGLY